jgi:hypothetical protein
MRQASGTLPMRRIQNVSELAGVHMGDKQQTKLAVEKALERLFPDDTGRTQAETSLLNDLHSLTAKGHLDSSELRIFARAIAGIGVVINERIASDG